MIYQVAKKRCSNSGRKRNDIARLESDFMVHPPSLLEFPGPVTPPPPWKFPIPSVVGVWIFSGTTQSSNALHFEKFGKVQKFDKNTFFYLRSCWKFQQFSRKRYKRAKAPIDLMLHMHLPVTQALRLHKNVSQNNFCNIALGFHCLHLGCVLFWRLK